MMTRRGFIGRFAAAAGLQLVSFFKFETAFAAKKKIVARALSIEMEDVTAFVNPKIGTGGHGHTYPGACVPFGAVQLSPDTGVGNWDHSSGYHADDKKIMGFSHTHLSGTGAGDLLDFLVTAGAGVIPPDAAHSSGFSHDDEIATPGYYSVHLQDHDLQAEMTATERVGVHRYTFSKKGTGYLLLDLSHSYSRSGSVKWSNLKVIAANGGPKGSFDTLIGGRSTNMWAPGRQIYFAMKVSKPFKYFEFHDEEGVLTDATEIKGSNIKCAMQFDVADGEAVLVKFAISGVSADGAMKNLETEAAGWDFDQVRQMAHDKWRAHLSRIRIQTSDLKKKEIFYTALYHTMVAPTLFDDVDGQYRGMDGAIHTLADGAHNYSTFSLWDTFRAVHPLYTLVQPERVPDLVNTLVRMANESHQGMPVWPLQGIETSCMTGYHSASVIAEACVKGFKGIDLQLAYTPMKKRAFDDDFVDMPSYRALGFIPADKAVESVSRALEYSYNDWAVAHVARLAGALQDAAVLFRRSLNYRNLFDRTTQFIRAKLKDGTWAVPFNPFDVGHARGRRDYTESNAWQTTFGIMHDPKGLIEQFGGVTPFVQKLDLLFNQSSALPSDVPIDMTTGMVGQYAHGNEPSHHVAYLYAYADCAYKTQARVRMLLETEYDNRPDGLAGNEDCGQMSAWYVMSAMGFYAVDPVSGNYVFGSPLFDLVRLELAHKKYLLLEAHRENNSDCYIQSITFNDAPFERAWFAHHEIAQGGHFILKMGPEPNLKFGVGAGRRPPSATTA